MSFEDVLRVLLYLGLLTLMAVPLGGWLARVYQGRARWSQRVLGPLERAIYRLGGVDPTEQMSWRRYAVSVLAFSVIGVAVVFLLQRLQGVLPLNPAQVPPVSAQVALNTAVSFATNTNWQAYSGEIGLSYLTQMLGLGVQNFVSAATGMAVLVALLRGFTAGRRAAPSQQTGGTAGTAGSAGSDGAVGPSLRSQTGLGSFWVDLTRTTVYVLLPLSLGLALLLVSQGVVQTFAGGVTATPLAGGAEQVIPLGPAASQIAIKQLGTNGGGFFGVNSAHPFENPTVFSNLLEVLSILLIPAALCFMFGAWVRDRRQGVAVYLAMVAIFTPLALATVAAEVGGNPALTALGAEQGVLTAGDTGATLAAGGNLEGKEVRFGAFETALWATATTAASNGSVNGMHDSFTALGGLAPLWLIQLGEVVFGGVGSGLYGLLLYALLAVFVAGLMVGRTPEYLGKKIEAFEIKMVALALLLPSACILVGTAVAVTTDAGLAPRTNPGPHGFTEVLYAFSSAAGNNGSAFAGLGADGDFYSLVLSVCMWVGRFGVLLPVLALAGSLAGKRPVPAGAGTLPTHGPLFVSLLVLTVVLVGALTFVPALALGPLVEHLLQAAG